MVLFLPTQLGKHFWPDSAYIHTIKVDYLSPTVYFWDLLVISLLVTWILQRPPINKTALNLLFLFILTQAVSLWQADVISGLVRLEQYLISGLFGVYLASQQFHQIKQQLYLPLAIAVLFESILAIFQVIKGSSIGFWILGERTFSISTLAIAKFDFYGQQFLRPYATFPHPNVLGAFLIITIPLLTLFAKVQTSWLKIKILLPVMVIAIIATVSRMSFIGLLMELIFFMHKRLLIFAIFMLFLFAPIILTRFSSTFTFDEISLFRREDLNGSAVALFLQNPFFGVGVNNFILHTANEMVSGPTRFMQPAHNIFLLILSETGLIGLFGLLALLSYPIVKLGLNLIKQAAHMLILLWLLIIFLGMFDHYFLTLPQGYRLLFVVWGLSLALLR